MAKHLTIREFSIEDIDAAALQIIKGATFTEKSRNKVINKLKYCREAHLSSHLFTTEERETIRRVYTGIFSQLFLMFKDDDPTFEEEEMWREIAKY